MKTMDFKVSWAYSGLSLATCLPSQVSSPCLAIKIKFNIENVIMILQKFNYICNH